MAVVTNYSPKKILITGGAGFIGTNFIRYLLNQQQTPTILNLDALTYAGSLDNLQDLPNKDCYCFVQGDISDFQLISRLLREYEIDTIIHFAAESHVDRSITGPAAFIQTNLVGTFTLLEAARQYWLTEKKWDESQCLFHHISTDEVYGSLQLEDPPCSESTTYAHLILLLKRGQTILLGPIPALTIYQPLQLIAQIIMAPINIMRNLYRQLSMPV